MLIYLNSYCIIIFLIVFFFCLFVKDDIMLVELSFLIYIFLIVANIII